MDCVRCGREAGYNRVVVDTVSDSELGGFCRNCEFDEFGKALDRFAGAGRQCAMCERDGHVAFATWTPVLRDGGERLVSAVEYDVTDRSPFLCDEHFHLISEGDATDGQPGRVRR